MIASRSSSMPDAASANAAGWPCTRLSIFHDRDPNRGDCSKGRRFYGFTKNGGIAERAVGSISALVKVPGSTFAAEATLVVTAVTLMQGLAELGGPAAGEGTAVIGPGPIGFLAVAKSLGANPAVLFGTHEDRNRIRPELLRTFSPTPGQRTRSPA